MNVHAKNEATASLLSKADPNLPALIVTGPQSIAVRAGTIFDGHTFDVETSVLLPDTGLIAGADYVVAVSRLGVAIAGAVEVPPSDVTFLGGFHFAPGGNAAARAGGDDVPAINPFSLWDVNFRPACADPRGMTLVDGPRGRFWCDIYLLGVDHLERGTSKFGATIADGDDLPMLGEREASRLDYETAVKVMAYHGKQLLALDEFFAAAFGVTEKTSCGRDPKKTKLDALRTSKWGVIQATGNLWVWGHDGDPDEPRGSVFGGSWLHDDSAGSRYALVDNWPGNSSEYLGARGRSDHLQPA
jgi:hypothetical protein